MSYAVETDLRFDRAFKKLDNYTMRILKSWITQNLIECENPRLHGKALQGKYKSLWRYRVGDYRIIANIEDEKLIILLLEIGHRKEIYK